MIIKPELSQAENEKNLREVERVLRIILAEGGQEDASKG